MTYLFKKRELKTKYRKAIDMHHLENNSASMLGNLTY